MFPCGTPDILQSYVCSRDRCLTPRAPAQSPRAAHPPGLMPADARTGVSPALREHARERSTAHPMQPCGTRGCRSRPFRSASSAPPRAARPLASGSFPVTHRTRCRSHRRASSVLAAVLALASAACTDRANPLAPAPGPGGGPGTPGTPVTIQTLECTGNRAELSVHCGPLQPGLNGASGDIIVGSQNVFVTVATSNVAYNGGTGQFTFNATLQNLIEQPMGTTDGTTLDPGGIKIFFHSGPTVTGGTGVASVLPDGFATFTAAGQPFYQYNQVLANSVTSGAKVWTLIMPPTVTTFSFLLYVSAPVEYPNGYVTLDGNLPDASYGYLHPGAPHPLVAVAKTAV